ncbi:PLP-dependent aminotransferase family protein [Paenibacillus bovis]|uniref:Aminotransferase class I/classII large domain-containing protein n=1 Tax=Paenibacillus bovis TaxID=1616788 RepID=A0A172ZGW4_9BACL|nr:PLP-dependent aminotransferase family protein [Paenibacillus bovis]ANF96874.1 hypothetical protein AR543_13215 [Paenibacillus bovis]
MNTVHQVPDLSRLSSRIPAAPSIGSTTVTKPDHIHLSFGFAADSLFPLEALEQSAQQAIRQDGARALQYSGAPGPAYILDWIQSRAASYGIDAETAQILVTNGATQGIALAAQLLLEPGDEVWVEAPTFFSALQAFRLCGASIRAFPIDGEGVQVDKLEEALIAAVHEGRPVPKLFYTMPVYHNPGGVTLSLSRRRQLADLARRYNFYIVEDDAYAELNFTGETFISLYELAPERTIYLNTFSKIIAPGIRLGWMIAHPLLVSRLRILMLGSSTAVFTQEIVAHLLKQLDFEQHRAQLIRHYWRQRDIMVTAIRSELGDEVSFELPEGGFFLWLTFPDQVNTAEMQYIAERHGVSYVAGSHFYHDDSGHNHLRLCFSYCTADRLTEGISRLAAAYREYREEHLHQGVDSYSQH